MRRTLPALIAVLLFTTIISAQAPVTPQILSVPVPLQIGATNATSGNMAGARNSTFQTLADTDSNAVPQSRPAMRAIDPELRFLQLGSGRVYTAYNWSSPPSRSLGEIARDLRNSPKPSNIRLYTNEDIERVSRESRVHGTLDHSSSSVSIGYRNDRLLPVSYQRSDNVAPVQTDTAPLSPPETDQTPPPLQAVPEDAQTDPTIPANASNDQLPPTASLLPLIAVLGTLLGIAGIVTRRWTP